MWPRGALKSHIVDVKPDLVHYGSHDNMICDDQCLCSSFVVFTVVKSSLVEIL